MTPRLFAKSNFNLQLRNRTQQAPQLLIPCNFGPPTPSGWYYDDMAVVLLFFCQLSHHVAGPTCHTHSLSLLHSRCHHLRSTVRRRGVGGSAPHAMAEARGRGGKGRHHTREAERGSFFSPFSPSSSPLATPRGAPRHPPSRHRRRRNPRPSSRSSRRRGTGGGGCSCGSRRACAASTSHHLHQQWRRRLHEGAHHAAAAPTAFAAVPAHAGAVPTCLPSICGRLPGAMLSVRRFATALPASLRHL